MFKEIRPYCLKKITLSAPVKMVRPLAPWCKEKCFALELLDPPFPVLVKCKYSFGDGRPIDELPTKNSWQCRSPI